MQEPDNMSGSAVNCYSQRLLNPFRGVVNIIRYKSAEAVTSDGIHWDVNVSNDSLLAGLAGKRSVRISDIRYGRWSKRKGLTRGQYTLRMSSTSWKKWVLLSIIIY